MKENVVYTFFFAWHSVPQLPESWKLACSVVMLVHGSHGDIFQRRMRWLHSLKDFTKTRSIQATRSRFHSPTSSPPCPGINGKFWLATEPRERLSRIFEAPHRKYKIEGKHFYQCAAISRCSVYYSTIYSRIYGIPLQGRFIQKTSAAESLPGSHV